MKFKLYIFNVLLGYDQFLNAIFGGDYRETMSSRVGRYKHENMVAKWVCEILNTIQAKHVEMAMAMQEKHDREVLK